MLKHRRPTNWVYVLECAGGRLYVGIAASVRARISRHCAGKGALFTRLFPPLAFVLALECPDETVAARLEVLLKKLSRTQKLAWARSVIASLRGAHDAHVELPGIRCVNSSGVADVLYARVVADLKYL